MHDNIGVSIGAALLAGGFLAATGVLQQRAAGRRPEKEALSFSLLISLARDRTWLLGLGTGILSYAFQGVALAFGALALVQPIFLSELLFAVPISVRLHGMRMHRREWVGVSTVASGLAIGLLSSFPRGGTSLPGVEPWMIALGVVGGMAGIALLVGRIAPGTARSSLYAFAAAAIMALQSALLSATVALMRHGIVALFTAWQPYALIPVTALGVLLVQSAYQAGPLAASMPVIDASEPSIAVLLGVALFSEHVSTGTWNLIGTGVGLLLFFVGIALLDTSPVVHRLQREQEEEREPSNSGADVSPTTA